MDSLRRVRREGFFADHEGDVGAFVYFVLIVSVTVDQAHVQQGCSTLARRADRVARLGADVRHDYAMCAAVLVRSPRRDGPAPPTRDQRVISLDIYELDLAASYLGDTVHQQFEQLQIMHRRSRDLRYQLPSYLTLALEHVPPQANFTGLPISIATLVTAQGKPMCTTGMQGLD